LPRPWNLTAPNHRVPCCAPFRQAQSLRRSVRASPDLPWTNRRGPFTCVRLASRYCRSTSPRKDSPLPVPRLTYAIGDVHGGSDLLRSLLAFIASDADRRGQEPRVIFLGDIVDRGPDSRGALRTWSSKPKALALVAAAARQSRRLILARHDGGRSRRANPCPLAAQRRPGHDYELRLMGDLDEARLTIRTGFADHLACSGPRH
jgi:hypothetical protein